jgi:hypothetical protein
MGAAGPTKLLKMCVVGVKSEATQNTAVALAATDYLLAESTEPEVVAEANARNVVHQSLDQIAHTIGKVSQSVKIRVEHKTSGTAGTVYGPLNALIKSAQMSSTATGGVSVAYAPISTAPAGMYGPATSCTIEVYMGIGATG